MGKPPAWTWIWEIALLLAVGLAFLGLALYLSTLSYALRSYSLSRLSAFLPESSRRSWFDWLARNQADLRVATGFARLLVVLCLPFVVTLWRFSEATSAPSPLEWTQTNAIALLALLVVAIAIPNALVRYAGEAILAYSLRPLAGLRVALMPVVWLAAGIDFVVMRLLGKTRDSDSDASERHEKEILTAVSEGEMYGAVDEEQADMIESVFELHDTDVAAIMTPRTDIVAISADSTFEQVREIAVRKGHSRIPVYEDTLDKIQGVLYVKDLLGLDAGQPFDARQVMRTVPYIPESKKISDLLDELRHAKVHIAIILDEYGGTAGLVTIEDIIEELVGEISDEYDAAETPPIKRIDADTLEVDARVHVTEINDELEVGLPIGADYDTVGGFVFSTLGRIPTTGEEFTHDNLHFRILEAEPRKIQRLSINVSREEQPA